MSSLSAKCVAVVSLHLRRSRPRVSLRNSPSLRVDLLTAAPGSSGTSCLLAVTASFFPLFFFLKKNKKKNSTSTFVKSWGTFNAVGEFLTREKPSSVECTLLLGFAARAASVRAFFIALATFSGPFWFFQLLLTDLAPNNL